MTDLQYRLSNGNWVDCGNRAEEFLRRCITETGKTRGADVSECEDLGLCTCLAVAEFEARKRDGENMRSTEVTERG